MVKAAGVQSRVSSSGKQLFTSIGDVFFVEVDRASNDANTPSHREHMITTLNTESTTMPQHMSYEIEVSLKTERKVHILIFNICFFGACDCPPHCIILYLTRKELTVE